jgi:hypothetical protein
LSRNRAAHPLAGFSPRAIDSSGSLKVIIGWLYDYSIIWPIIFSVAAQIIAIPIFIDFEETTRPEQQE